MKKLNIKVEDFLQKNQNSNLNIIDIRDAYSYNKGHIPNARNIPANYLIGQSESVLSKRDTYYIYCQSGTTSSRVVNILNQKGYHVYNLIGGYNNYLLWK